jgi:ABC-2 type transport system permease protein
MGAMLAIIEREIRKFLRSPTLMLTSMVMPLIQLIVLGNALGGKITEARMGVVDLDGGSQAVRVQEAFDSVAATARTFRTFRYADERSAQEDVRNGRIDAAIIIPRQFSRRVYQSNAPQLGMILDNSDQFLSSSLQAKMTELTAALNQPAVPQRQPGQIALEIVELYPYIEYMKFLLPGSVTLAMFISVMIGGGMLYIDDKARGVHEGYLVTPITKLELVGGLVLSGSLKAVLAGMVLCLAGGLIAGLGIVLHPMVLLELLLMAVATSLAFNSLMFLLMVRIDDPLVPRALFGVLNTLLYFPSGAIYPIRSFPTWLRAISVVNPFTYAVHGFRAVMVKETGLQAVSFDIVYLLLFSALAMTLAVPLFKRTL